MKAKIIETQHGVTILYDDPISGERIHRFFSCPEDGGSVYEIDSRNAAIPVGPALSGQGFVYSKSRRELGKVIRREWNNLRRYFKKEGIR